MYDHFIINLSMELYFFIGSLFILNYLSGINRVLMSKIKFELNFTITLWSKFARVSKNYILLPIIL
jgi:hypothetical protein